MEATLSHASGCNIDIIEAQMEVEGGDKDCII